MSPRKVSDTPHDTPGNASSGATTKRHTGNHEGTYRNAGGSSISITQRAAERRATTASTTPTTTPTTVTAGMLGGLFLLLMGAGLATAAPAQAVDDPSRPDARVTHGPSCRPGGLVVEVTAGSAPYHVRLATTRQPSGEDEATVAPGTTVTLRSDDVAWGETIDGRLEYAARDGSGVTYADELEHYSFTRPTREDCDAVHDPTQPHPSPSVTAAQSSTGSQRPGGGSEPSPTPSRTPVEPTPAPTDRPQDSDAGAAPAGPPSSGSASAGSVAPGDTVTVQGAGFLPGERVVVQLRGGAVLAAVTARSDGTVSTEIRIPERTASGPATVDLVGDVSAVVADVALQVAALETPASADGADALVPLIAASGALVVTVAGFVRVAGRRPRRMIADHAAPAGTN